MHTRVQPGPLAGSIIVVEDGCATCILKARSRMVGRQLLFLPSIDSGIRVTLFRSQVVRTIFRQSVDSAVAAAAQVRVSSPHRAQTSSTATQSFSLTAGGTCFHFFWGLDSCLVALKLATRMVWLPCNRAWLRFVPNPNLKPKPEDKMDMIKINLKQSVEPKPVTLA